MNTILTRLSTELIEQYTQAGFWRQDTIYSLVKGHARANARPFRDPRPLSPHHLSPTGRCRRRARRRSRPARGAVGAARVGVAAEPDRERGRAAGLLAQRLRVLPVAAPRPYGRRDRRTDAAHALRLAFIVQNGYGADADKRDVIGRGRRCSELAPCLPARSALRIVAVVAELVPAIHDSTSRPRSRRQSRCGNAKTDPNQIVYLAFTSGTTGKPKGVMHSDNTLLANARAMASDWSIDRSPCIYTLSPLSHNLGFGAHGDGAGRRAANWSCTICRAARASSIASWKPAPASWSACRPTPSTCWRRCASAG